MARPKLDRPNYTLRRNRSGYYEVRWTEGGKTRSVSTGHADEKLAKIWRDRFVEHEHKEAVPDEPSISEICTGYYKAKENDLTRPENLDYSFRTVKAELGNLTPGLITQDTLRRYAMARRDKANDTSGAN